MSKTSGLNAAINQLDQALFSAVQGINILDAVAPLNYRQQKEEFFSSSYSVNPQFNYADHSLDLFQKKRDLFNLPIEQLKDDALMRLYSSVIESYVDKLDQYKAIGTPEFLYDSLRYFGEPTEKDIDNARFILHLPDDIDPRADVLFDAVEIQQRLEDFAIHEGYEYQIKLDESLIANALVSGLTVKINTSAMASETEIKALAHHELGVHLVTTLNARSQPLQILTLGSPVNTTTQEGLAILCEYLSGCLTLPRLKVLALRVVAVQSMLEDKEFKKTFALLKDKYLVGDDLAFTITARVYRGGGFTKDYLYLQGFHQMLHAYENQRDFTHLLAGKVSLEQLPIISQLIEKEYLVAPQYISPAIASPEPLDDVHKFIAHAIK
ncbi:flavohemoglobin expression-modulating QEGLA motif protein [Litoribrevibacter albus]|uniref:Flavohemoglobin expression-modulating QEGLA motif protein n=1 Tax=Litoribrevibacter albus TaxID=1473156 RepID=A0AA37S673_9GAMM|nr:flavohemoglobin expression-modulating QEGLA motif protein [Litoribrevibacter albus]GLQ29662.1 hypothetical protein GCM10007876_01400 [Litoribrevibacter albus]